MNGDEGRIKKMLTNATLSTLNTLVEFNSKLQVDALVTVRVDQEDVFSVHIHDVILCTEKSSSGGVTEHSTTYHSSDDSSDDEFGLLSPAPILKNPSITYSRSKRDPNSAHGNNTNDKQLRFSSLPDLTTISAENREAMVECDNCTEDIDLPMTNPHVTFVQSRKTRVGSKHRVVPNVVDSDLPLMNPSTNSGERNKAKSVSKNAAADIIPLNIPSVNNTMVWSPNGAIDIDILSASLSSNMPPTTRRVERGIVRTVKHPQVSLPHIVSCSSEADYDGGDVDGGDKDDYDSDDDDDDGSGGRDNDEGDGGGCGDNDDDNDNDDGSGGRDNARDGDDGDDDDDDDGDGGGRDDGDDCSGGGNDDDDGDGGDDDDDDNRGGGDVKHGDGKHGDDDDDDGDDDNAGGDYGSDDNDGDEDCDKDCCSGDNDNDDGGDKDDDDNNDNSEDDPDGCCDEEDHGANCYCDDYSSVLTKPVAESESTEEPDCEHSALFKGKF